MGKHRQVRNYIENLLLNHVIWKDDFTKNYNYIYSTFKIKIWFEVGLKSFSPAKTFLKLIEIFVKTTKSNLPTKSYFKPKLYFLLLVSISNIFFKFYFNKKFSKGIKKIK